MSFEDAWENLTRGRYRLGDLTEAGGGGGMEEINVLEDRSVGDVLPPWWPWHSWHNWWFHFNGAGQATWNLKLAAGECAVLNYSWNHYWR